MRAVLGIGNPGVKYVDTRHNAGFIVIDRFIGQMNLNYKSSKSEFLFAEGKLNNTEYLIVRPTTYVNNSGLAAVYVLDNFELSVEDLLVVVDDINLPLGNIRVRNKGGSGGHNGLESIIYHLLSDKFPRIRFGIGSDFEDGTQADYVLSKFSNTVFEQLKPNFDFAVELVENFILGGQKQMIDHFSMFSNKFNKKNPPPEREEN